MSETEPNDRRGKGFSRVYRLRGKARRLSAPPGPVAVWLHALDDWVKADRAARSAAYAALVETFEPARAAGAAYAAALTALAVDTLTDCGHRRVRGGWRMRRVTVDLFFHLDGGEAPDPARLAAVADLGRTAHEAWVHLLAGADAGRRAAVVAEVAAKRAAWVRPGDPPALLLLADGLALAFVEQRYFAALHARGRDARVPDDQLTLLARRAYDADRRLAALDAELAAARLAHARWAAVRVKVDRLRAQAEKRRAGKTARGPRSAKGGGRGRG